MLITQFLLLTDFIICRDRRLVASGWIVSNIWHVQVLQRPALRICSDRVSRRVMREEEPLQKHYRQKKQVQIARNKVLTDNRGQISRLGVKQNPVGLEIEVTRFNHLHLSCMSTTFWPGLCHIAGEGNGTPLQYSCLENPMDGRAWWAAVHGVAKSLTRLSNFTFTFHFHVLEKEMATHSSVLAWRIPGTGEPGGLPPMGSHRVGHDCSDLAAAAAVGEP